MAAAEAYQELYSGDIGWEGKYDDVLYNMYSDALQHVLGTFEALLKGIVDQANLKAVRTSTEGLERVDEGVLCGFEKDLTRKHLDNWGFRRESFTR